MICTGALGEISACCRDHFTVDPARRGVAADCTPGNCCELSGGLRKSGFEAEGCSKAVGLRNPVMSVANGLAGGFVGVEGD